MARTVLLLATLILPLGCVALPAPGSGSPGGPDTGVSAQASSYEATIRRTAFGVAHIEAADVGGLGFGEGYAQAEDHLCTIGDQVILVLTYGQSGDPESEHFIDQTELFARKEWRPVLTDPAAVAAGASRTYRVVGPR